MKTHADKPALTTSASWSGVEALPPIAGRQFSDNKTTIGISDTPSPEVPRPPIQDKFTILEEGQIGGMGIVYKVRDAELDRIVALKMIKGGVFATDEALVRFHREARAAARLNHPNIIPVYEIGQVRGCPFFTMAFAEGGSLAQQRERFADSCAAAALVETIARAVHHAHQRGILHRDLKPGNILFDENGIPLVSDFSLAKFIDASQELTQSGALLGTPSYMAPEQANGQLDQVSAQTDVWALGVILYELLTGQQPFKGLSHEESLRKVRTMEPRRPRFVNRSLDRMLETVALKCLEKEPSRRYASAEALADDLARWLRGESVLARPPSRLIRAVRAIRRYRAPVLRVVFAAVILALVALAWKGIPSSTPPVEEGERSAMEGMLARLRKGENVTLLGESMRPSWMRWHLRRGPGTSSAKLDKGRIFRVQAWKQPILVELLPSAPPRYRLRAQVQHIDSQSELGKVGIYFGHSKRPTEEGATHCSFRVDFNDRIPTLKPRNATISSESQVRLNFSILRETKEDLFASQVYITTAISLRFAPAGEVEPMPWRTLEVEVTPDWIKTYWEGELIKAAIAKTISGGTKTDGVDPKTVLAKVGLSRSAIPFADVELTSGKAIGLYVEKGVAAFRSVVIEPLPQQ